MTSVIRTSQEWQTIRKKLPSDMTLGFVPTMGNLHDGHASLLKRAKHENDLTVISIFVNPTQFNQQSDLDRYPRTFNPDLELITKLNIDYLFYPEAHDIYHDNYHYQVSEKHDSSRMEGQYRQGHFNGVLTVVLKLFSLIKPHRAYFGEKDYQQLYLIKEMVKAFFMDIDIVACETIRESSGLAMSSRNNHLSDVEKKQASLISQFLSKNSQIDVIKEELIQAGFDVDYVEKWQDRIFAAVTLGGVRLIDNVPVRNEC